MNRKGIILAGGEGTRLYPLTKNTSKQMLPIYNKPMIYYPLSILMLGGIEEVLIITTPRDNKEFRNLLGDGKQWNLSISYEEQSKPEGIAQSFLIAEKWLKNSNSVLILGDNLFFGNGLPKLMKNVFSKKNGATIFLHKVIDPERYGVVELNDKKEITNIIEKPKKFISNWAVTGMYSYDNNAPLYVKDLKPSSRGELEITDLNKIYLDEKNLSAEFLGQGFTWLDMGTHDSLIEAANFVKIIESRQGIRIADLDNLQSY
ncbi:MAG: glucose-1-phosphate thymidylyltransferase [Candidatus Marinimicrobia bacterium]|nr:glucose-1-phosphate thymidylyltransferase [Candidatus Neomarinimicrobiota bacterium]MBH11207.1 glucose-1-phosphate thymidylyltransferase [Candidatus Neomarinimicrobiota bacterium]